MDFEVLGEEENDRLPLRALDSYFRNRRRQLQDWDSNPPHILGIFVLILSLCEAVLSWRLLNGSGFSSSIFTHSLMAASAVVLVEVGLARIAFEVAGFFNKKGKVGTAVTFFNLGLIPMLFVLPLAVVAYASHLFRPFAVIGFLLLLTRTLGNWRESLEISFELSKFQSALVIYLASGVFTVFVLLAGYVGFLTSVLSAFN